MNDILPSTIKRTVIYLYLLSFTLPEQVSELPPLREELGEDWSRAVEAAARLMVAFQQASRNPDTELVAGLTRADSSPEACRAFQEKMDALAQLPGRAKMENRLHRKRGCRLCETPCRYGYFSLLTEPDFSVLHKMLGEQPGVPVQTVWQFTLMHLAKSLALGRWYIGAHHLGNLAYCLVSLATAKSRYPFPEAQMKKFQAMNQEMIRNP